MKRRFLLQSLLAFCLLLGIAVYAGRLLRLTGDWQLDLGGREPATLSAETVSFLRGLEQNLSITYFVSPRARMPSHLKEVEEEVRRLLAAMAGRAPQRVDYRVIYPEASGPAGLLHAARKKVSSFSVRRVLQDEQSEQKVWSSLVLAYGSRPEVLIQGVEAKDLPYLEALIVENLKSLDRPPVPIFAVAAPAGFQLLSSFLNEYGRVVEVDLNGGAAIPREADVLFWMQPATATPTQVRQLRHFVDTGRTAVLAGSEYAVGFLPEGKGAPYAIRRMPPGWSQLIEPLGLRGIPDLLMDANSGQVFVSGEGGEVRRVEAPFLLRCLPAFYDMKSFQGPARGGLSFVAASALEIDPRRVAEAGFQAEIVGTTTEKAWVAPLPEEPFGEEYLEPRLQVPKQNLMVLLKTDDPWKGQIFALASASPFQDGIINQPGYAHQVFLRTLVRTFTERQRLVRIRVDRFAPEKLPPLGAGTRTFWRLVVVFAVPAVLLGLGGWRYLGGGIGEARRLAGSGLRLGGGLALILLIGQVGRLGGRFYLDLSEGRINSPAPLTLKAMAEAEEDLQAELILSPRAVLPAPLKGIEGRVRALLEEGGVEVRRIRPDPAGESGIEPFAVEGVVDDTLTARRVWSGLRLREGGRVAVIPRLDGRTADHLEFLLTAALKRLETGRAPHVAVVSDLPRLSPAEALEDFHRKGLIPPGGVDVYSGVKELLAGYGYRVSHVDPRAPELPEGVDLVLWLQPRRDSTPVLQQVSEYLAGGGKGIVALQQFNIQQRQYRGSGFQTVYWPQPQFQDLDRYLRMFGVEQVREVLMDRTQSHLDLETQVNRTAVREYDPQQVALPFLIRAVGAHYDADSPITRRLGDLLFIWGNRFALDAAKMAEAGVRGRVLITTSDRAWAYPWKGGWLPPEVFTASEYLPGRQPLAVLLEGRFPSVELREEEGGKRELVESGRSGREGTLLLIGCSEMFKNDHLYTPGFQHDQFLLNAVAQLTYGEEMAALQGRRPTVRGFSFQNPSVKTFWRVAAVWTGPLLFLLYGLLRLWQGRRPLRWA